MWCYCHYKHFSKAPLCLPNAVVVAVAVFIVYSCDDMRDDGVRHSRAESKRSIDQSRLFWINLTRVVCVSIIMHRIIELLFSIIKSMLMCVRDQHLMFHRFFSLLLLFFKNVLFISCFFKPAAYFIEKTVLNLFFLFYSWQIVMFKQNDVENIRSNL